MESGHNNVSILWQSYSCFRTCLSTVASTKNQLQVRLV